MISVILIGGLGNQLFQIFFIISYSLKHNINCCLPPKLSNESRTKTYWNSIFKNVKPKIANVSFPRHNEQGFHYQEFPRVNEHRFNGFFQSWKYFSDYFDKIYDILDIKSFKNKYPVSKYVNTENSVVTSMHFRLGDYKIPAVNAAHNILHIDYYRKAIKTLIDKTHNSKQHVILYFCEKEDDNIVYTHINKLQVDFKNIKFVKTSNDLDDYEQMMLMSNCDNNIIANSSFSWWGAQFNRNLEKIVICPNEWFGEKLKHYNIDDLFYDSYIRID